MPARLLAVSDQRAMRAELDGLADGGVDVGLLAGCMGRWAVDPLFVSRKVPVPGERWLSSGMWEGSLAAAEPEAGSAAAMPAMPPGCGEPVTAAWMTTMAAVQAAVGETAFGSYLARAVLGQIGPDFYLVAATGVARDWIEARCWSLIAETWGRTGCAEVRLFLATKMQFETLLRQPDTSRRGSE